MTTATLEPDHGVVECRVCGRPHRGGVPFGETLTHLVIDPSMLPLAGTEIARMRLMPQRRWEADHQEAMGIADQVLDRHGEAFRRLKDL